jgi:hypothetical protein
MLKNDCRRDVPGWLRDLRLEKLTDLEDVAFPLENALEHSLYYPAAGCDGDPVRILGGFIHSFFYVDYRICENKVDEEARWRGFSGYRLAGRKQLSERDLAPNGWSPIIPENFKGDMDRFDQIRSDVNLKNPFAIWYVFDRISQSREDRGPERFSLVFICADGVATYQALYWPNKTAPDVLAIIQPGHAFGFNYTDFTNHEGFFAWTVMHKAQTPEYLMCGGMSNDYPQAFWPDVYPEHIEWWDRQDGGGGIWRRKKATDSKLPSGSNEETTKASAEKPISNCFLRVIVEKVKVWLGVGRRKTPS